MERKKRNECHISSCCITFCCCKNCIALSKPVSKPQSFCGKCFWGRSTFDSIECLQFSFAAIAQEHSNVIHQGVSNVCTQTQHSQFDNSPRFAITSTPAAVRNQRFNVWEKDAKSPNRLPSSLQALSVDLAVED